MARSARWAKPTSTSNNPKSHCELLGVIYAGEHESFHWEMPNNGVGGLDVALYWRLSSGDVRCWSLSKLLSCDVNQLRGEHDAFAYHAMAQRESVIALGDISKEQYCLVA